MGDCKRGARHRGVLPIFCFLPTIASNNAVTRACTSAHGTGTCWTPCSAQRTRGTSARTSVRYCIVSRCRHIRGRRSYPRTRCPAGRADRRLAHELHAYFHVTLLKGQPHVVHPPRGARCPTGVRRRSSLSSGECTQWADGSVRPQPALSRRERRVTQRAVAQRRRREAS